MGFGNTTDSAFAEILLHCSHNGTRDSGEIVSSVEAEQLPSTSGKLCTGLAHRLDL